ncbi:MAG: THUMP domain-containing class I SAM-dependent RNA methyltransferase [Rhodothermales bacterium]
MNYKYQEFGRFFAQFAGGLEDEGAAELTELGAADVATAYRGCFFTADSAGVYRINYQSRLATRILAPLTSFGCHSTEYLYRSLRDIDWTDFMDVDNTFAVFANVSNSKIRHSKYAALRVKDAVVDSFRDSCGRRPNVDTRSPHVWFNLHIENNHCTLSLDTSGGSLHRRGYRQAAGAAPMQETVAAAVIRFAGWDGERPMFDPMCGSGTLLAEALMHFCRIPAGYLRDHFGFMALPDFDAQLWRQVKMNADRRVRPLPPGLIRGSDVDASIVAVARQNLNSLPNGDRVEIRVADVFEHAGCTNETIITNPPYGVRMGEKQQVGEQIRRLGDFFKQRCTGSTAYLYLGDRAMIKKVGLRPKSKKPLTSGSLDGRLVAYELY